MTEQQDDPILQVFEELSTTLEQIKALQQTAEQREKILYKSLTEMRVNDSKQTEAIEQLMQQVKEQRQVVSDSLQKQHDAFMSEAKKLKPQHIGSLDKYTRAVLLTCFLAVAASIGGTAYLFKAKTATEIQAILDDYERTKNERDFYLRKYPKLQKEYVKSLK